MKKNEIIFIGVIVLVGTLIVFLISRGNANKKDNNAQAETQQPVEEYVQVLSDGTKLNSSEALKQAKMLDGLKFENIQLTNRNNQTVLLANVTNTTSSKTEMKEVDVVILNKEGQEIGRVGGIIIPLDPGQSTQFNTSTTMNYANAYDFKIERSK